MPATHLSSASPELAALLAAFFVPFVQEDLAVFGAAAAAAAGLAPTPALFAVLLLGLTVSDVWKYWAGRLARSQAWARRLVEKPAVAAARDRVLNHLAAAMFIARFVPGTRIPLYLASGVFKAPFGLFFTYVVGSAALYVTVIFLLVAGIGELAGRDVAARLPLFVLGLAALAFSIRFARDWLRRRSAAAAG